MKSFVIKSIKDVVKYWYIPLLVGLFFVVVSIVAFTSAESSLLALSILFALSFIMGGLLEILFSITNRNYMENWGWSLAFGIITFVVGLLLIIRPALSLSVLAFYIGFVILFRSVAAISYAIDMKGYGSRAWGGLLGLGILGAIFSFILIWNPVFAGMSIVVLVALSFLFAGLFSIYFSLQLRKLNKASKTISAKLRARYDDIIREIREELEN